MHGWYETQQLHIEKTPTNDDIAVGYGTCPKFEVCCLQRYVWKARSLMSQWFNMRVARTWCRWSLYPAELLWCSYTTFTATLNTVWNRHAWTRILLSWNIWVTIQTTASFHPWSLGPSCLGHVNGILFLKRSAANEKRENNENRVNREKSLTDGVPGWIYIYIHFFVLRSRHFWFFHSSTFSICFCFFFYLNSSPSTSPFFGGGGGDDELILCLCISLSTFFISFNILHLMDCMICMYLHINHSHHTIFTLYVSSDSEGMQKKKKREKRLHHRFLKIFICELERCVALDHASTSSFFWELRALKIFTSIYVFYEGDEKWDEINEPWDFPKGKKNSDWSIH